MSSNARQLAANLPRQGGLSNRNMVINGDFSVWQRGTSWAVGQSGYKADRYQDQNNAAFERSTDAPDGFKYSAYIHSWNGGAHQLNHHIENTGQFYVGQVLTISMYAKANRNGVGIKMGALYSPSDTASVVSTDAVLKTLTTDWQRYTTTVTINSNWSGNSSSLMTYPYGNLSDTELGWTTSDWIRITGFQIEVGDTATPFEHRSYGQELALCQRYYFRKSYPNDRHLGNGRWEGSSVSGTVFFPQTMRTTPTVTANTTGMRAVNPTVAWYSLNSLNQVHKTGTQSLEMFFSASASGDNKGTSVIDFDTGGFVAFDAEVS